MVLRIEFLLLIVLTGCGRTTQVTFVPSTQAPTTTQSKDGADPPYEAIEDAVQPGADQIFGLCRQIPDDQDAANMFLWMSRTVHDLNDKRLDHQSKSEKPWSTFERKSTYTYCGEVFADNERMRLAIMQNIPTTAGHSVIDAARRTTQEMQHRLEEWLKSQPAQKAE